MSLILALLMSLLPHATASAESPFVLKYHRGTGHSPNPMTFTTTIYYNGSVRQTVKQLNNKTVSNKNLGQLSAPQMASIRRGITKLNEADLQDTRPDDPFCADIPDETYSARRMNGKIIEFSKSHSCHDFEMLNSAEAQAFKNLLKGHWQVAELP